MEEIISTALMPLNSAKQWFLSPSVTSLSTMILQGTGILMTFSLTSPLEIQVIMSAKLLVAIFGTQDSVGQSPSPTKIN